MRHKLILLWGLFVLFSAFKADEQVVTIFMIGDSTMADKDVSGGNPERGWGQMLPGYLSEEVRVYNHAVNGRSSKSFIDEGRWQEVLSLINKGDYVFIQFGHNDEKPDPERHTDPCGGTFDANLRRFVTETRAKGGIPVLFNSIVRRNFGVAQTVDSAVVQYDFRKDANLDAKRDASLLLRAQEGGRLIDTHGAYLDSPRKVAEALNVPFVDMNRITHKLVEELGPDKSKELFMWVPPGRVPALPKGREDNTHLNIHGARTVAQLAAEALVKEVPQLAKYIRHYDFVVAKDGSGDFFTIQEAVDAVPDYRKDVRTSILIRKGVYREKVVIPESKAGLCLIGQEGVTLSYDDYAAKVNRFGESIGTSGSSSSYIYAHDFYAENITFENTSGPVGQAVACFISADRVIFKGCRFLGYQDTLYTYGKRGRLYFCDCYIEGTVDFIFGCSVAVFDRCRIHSKGKGYVTAPSTERGQRYGYVFYDCKLTADEGVDKVYLSRPWRPYAQAVFVLCEMGHHIIGAGWDNWRNKENEKTVFYAEYRSRGAGAAPGERATFSHQLKDVKDYAIETVLAGEDGWNPLKNGNALLKVRR